jgi:uncharacterized protein (DUF983 family)
MSDIPVPSSVLPVDPLAPRKTAEAMMRGARLQCPSCGEGPMFSSYLKVADACASCGEELHHHRADDAPAYFTISIVGHVVVAGALLLERFYAPETWVHMVLWLPLTLLLSLALLPVIKGALVGLQWSNRMHGFGGVEDAPEPEPMAPSEGGASKSRWPH